MVRYLLQGGTTTPQSSSSRYSYPYSFWIAGHYEDFNSMFCIPDANTETLQLHQDTHHGNPMNAEARLNPHFRWSVGDRDATWTQTTTTVSGLLINYSVSATKGKVVHNFKQLHNEGVHDWLTFDFTRLNNGKSFSSVTNNEYVDSLAHANRSRYRGMGGYDSYIKTSPSHQSSGSFIFHNGEIDSAIGREDANVYGGVNGGSPTSHNAYTTMPFDYYVDGYPIGHTAEIKTTGSFTAKSHSWNDAASGVDRDLTLSPTIRSPSGAPFLLTKHTFARDMPCIMTASSGTAGTLTATTTAGTTFDARSFRVGDQVSLWGAGFAFNQRDYCVIQEINAENGNITKLLDIGTGAQWVPNKWDPSHGSFVSGSALNSVSVSKSFHPLLTFDGPIGFQRDYDVFHMRLAPMLMKDNALPTTDKIGQYLFRVGFLKSTAEGNIQAEGNRYKLGDFDIAKTVAAIEFEIQPHALNTSNTAYHRDTLKGSGQVSKSQTHFNSTVRNLHPAAFVRVDDTSTVSAPNYTGTDNFWMDLDVVVDFSNQRYRILIDSHEDSTGWRAFETKPGGGSWTAADLYGYHVDIGMGVNAATSPSVYGNNDLETFITLFDRIAVIEEITNPVSHTPNLSARTNLIVGSMDLKMRVNGSSMMKINVFDDDNERKFASLFGDSPSQSRLLMFKNGIDSPMWSGIINGVQVKQSLENTKEFIISASDSIYQMDYIMPFWEVGQSFNTPNVNYQYKRVEAEMMMENLYLGVAKLVAGSMKLGVDHESRLLDSYDDALNAQVNGLYGPRYDQRTRLYSGNPIQMYLGEDDDLPFAKPDSFNTTPTARDSDTAVWRAWNTKRILGFSDGSYHGLYYVVAHCIEHGLEVDDTFTIYGAYGKNAFTIKDEDDADGLAITVKKVIDDNHFAFLYNSTSSDAGRAGNERRHWYSILCMPFSTMGEFTPGLVLETDDEKLYDNISGGAYIDPRTNWSAYPMLAPFEAWETHKSFHAVSTTTGFNGASTSVGPTTISLRDASQFDTQGFGFINMRADLTKRNNVYTSGHSSAGNPITPEHMTGTGNSMSNHAAFKWTGKSGNDLTGCVSAGLNPGVASSSDQLTTNFDDGAGTVTDGNNYGFGLPPLQASPGGSGYYFVGATVYQVSGDNYSNARDTPVWKPHPLHFPNEFGERRRHHMGRFDPSVLNFWNGFNSPLYYRSKDFTSINAGHTDGNHYTAVLEPIIASRWDYGSWHRHTPYTVSTSDGTSQSLKIRAHYGTMPTPITTPTNGTLWNYGHHGEDVFPWTDISAAGDKLTTFTPAVIHYTFSSRTEATGVHNMGQNGPNKLSDTQISSLNFKPAGIVRLSAPRNTSANPIFADQDDQFVTVGPRPLFRPAVTNNTQFSRSLDWALSYVDNHSGTNTNGERSQLLSVAKHWVPQRWEGRFLQGDDNPVTDYGGVNDINHMNYWGYSGSSNTWPTYRSFRVNRTLRKGVATSSPHDESDTIISSGVPCLLLRGNEIDQFDPKNIASQPFAWESDGLYYRRDGGDRYNLESPLMDIHDIQEYDAHKIYFNAASNPNTAYVPTGDIWAFPDSGYAYIPLNSGTYTGGTAVSGPAANDALIHWTGVDRTASPPQLTGITQTQIGDGLTTRSYPTSSTHTSNRDSCIPLVFPMVCYAQAIFEPPAARQQKQKYRPAHACYMHDIAKSVWFRTVFGIIQEHAHGVHGPAYNVKTYTTYFPATFSFNIPVNQTRSAATGIGHRDYFTVASNYASGASTLVITPHSGIPMIDSNFNDRRWIDGGSTTVNKGTDPLISIPSRAANSSSYQSMTNGGLIFEMENTDGSLDIGYATSAQMTSCKSSGDTHYEISAIEHLPLPNGDGGISWFGERWGEAIYPNKSIDSVLVGEIRLYGCYDPAYYFSSGSIIAAHSSTMTTSDLHSGHATTPVGHNPSSGLKAFPGIAIGDTIFVGNTQGLTQNGSASTLVTASNTERFSPKNPNGDARDLYSYRWYRVIDVKDEYISVFPAEVASEDFETYAHPIGANTASTGSVAYSNPYGYSQRGRLPRSTSQSNPTHGSTSYSATTDPGKRICNLYCGNVTLSGVKMLKNAHAAGATGRFRIIENSFKHIWVLWADMRNDGTASADNGLRASTFGLKTPTADNYKVSLKFARTQTDITELAVNEDLDIWDLGGTDPVTGAAWSANYSNTITSSIATHLHNWESKAGAPIVIDCSKFFNLNTWANGGRTGQSSGGMKNMSDYYLDSAGTPELMDSYWREVAPLPHTAKYRIKYDVNRRFFSNYETRLSPNTGTRDPIWIVDSSKFYEGLYWPSQIFGNISNISDSDDSVSQWITRLRGYLVSSYQESTDSDAVRLYMGKALPRGPNTLVDSLNTFYFDQNSTWNATSGSSMIPDGATNFSLHSSAAATGALQAMMVVEGYVETGGKNTLYDFDKIRMLWNLPRVQTWFGGSTPPCGYDINNVPRIAVGGVVDGRGKSIGSIIKSMKKSTGNDSTDLHYLIGRDNRFEFRPSYSMGITLDRSILKRSDLTAQSSVQFSHVRVFYNNGASFVDYPNTTTPSGDYQFKMVDAYQLSSPAEANALAENEYRKGKSNRADISAEIVREAGQSNTMFDGGRYGYISSAYLQMFPGNVASSEGINANMSTLFHTSTMGGSIIGGRMNAMDGNMDGLLFTRLKAKYGSSYSVDAKGDVYDHIYIGEREDWVYENEGMGYHSGSGTCWQGRIHQSRWEGQFTAYGLSSVDKAVQIVHVPKDTPLVSGTHGDRLRIFVAHNGSDGQKKFKVWLIDAAYSTSVDEWTAVTNSNQISSVDCNDNGFFEIAIPTSYGASTDAKITFSFNADYCHDLVNYRSGYVDGSIANPKRGGNRVFTPSFFSGSLGSTGLYDTSGGQFANEGSAFPLGLPEFNSSTRPVNWNGSPSAGSSSLYYASCIHIVEDFVFRPGSVVRYTDAFLDIDQNMTLTEINYKVKGQKHEQMNLKLQKEERRDIQSLTSFIPRPQPAAPSPPSDDSDGGGGYGGGFPNGPPLNPGRPGLPGGGGWSAGYGSFTGSVGSGSGVGSLKTLNTGGNPNQEAGSFTGLDQEPSSRPKVNYNSLSKTSIAMTKGSADSYSDAEGVSGFLGINRNKSHVNSNKFLEEVNAQVVSSSEQDGFTLGGITHSTSDGVPTQGDLQTGSVFVVIPTSVTDSSIAVDAIITAPETGVNYELMVKVENVDNDFTARNTVLITGASGRQSINLLPTTPMGQVGEPGSRLKVTISRIPGGSMLVDTSKGGGLDAAPFSSVIIHTTSFKFNVRKKTSNNTQSIMNNIKAGSEGFRESNVVFRNHSVDAEIGTSGGIESSDESLVGGSTTFDAPE